MYSATSTAANLGRSMTLASKHGNGQRWDLLSEPVSHSAPQSRAFKRDPNAVDSELRKMMTTPLSGSSSNGG